MIQKETLTYAEHIEKKHGTSYYIATLFFPKEIREAVFILYAFVRTPDEFVDNPEEGSDPHAKLIQWKTDWEHAYKRHSTDNKLLTATAEIFKRYDIPFDWSQTFIDAMIQDTRVSRYATYADLKAYMHGSAETVGLMLTYIIGYYDPRALQYAVILAEAMQLTNFLRDIHEDYRERGRIYLPQEDMNHFHVTEAMIAQQEVTPEFIHLMKFEIHRAHQLFKQAELGICMLSHKGQFPVRLASRLYEKILDKIEEEHYDIFTTRARSTTLEKIWLTITTYVSH